MLTMLPRLIAESSQPAGHRLDLRAQLVPS